MLTKKSRHPKNDDLSVRGAQQAKQLFTVQSACAELHHKLARLGITMYFFSEHRHKISVSVTANFPVSEITRPHQPVSGDTLS